MELRGSLGGFCLAGDMGRGRGPSLPIHSLLTSLSRTGSAGGCLAQVDGGQAHTPSQYSEPGKEMLPSVAEKRVL